LWDEKHNKEDSSNDQSKKKNSNVVEHKDEEVLCAFMDKNKDSKSGKNDWYID